MSAMDEKKNVKTLLDVVVCFKLVYWTTWIGRTTNPLAFPIETNSPARIYCIVLYCILFRFQLIKPQPNEELSAV